MNKIITSALILAGTLTSLSVCATERMYGVASIGYSDVDYDGTKSSGPAYRLALGHQFHRQWYVELGYQDLVDDEPSGLGEGLSAEALSISVLGKAANRQGELFYRLGLANIDITGQGLANEEGICTNGSAVGMLEELGTVCGFDESVFGGIVGLGFDFYVGLNSMIRLEGEYIYGEDDYSNGAIYLGFRYNFN